MFTVVLDSCVILPATLNDSILRLAEARCFGVRWSTDIMEEVRRNMIGKFNLPPDTADKRIGAMREAFPFADIKGYENLIPVMSNDSKDRHVLAAAVRSDAHTIVTNNLKDFPPESLDPWGIEAVHPDQFLLSQLDLSPRKVLDTLKNQVDDNKYPPKSADELFASLRRCGVPDFADELSRHW
ncbi:MULTISPECIES: PIN domain-containing protein [unclassified Corynebacterium]|uniref:PIN domain-containing protein n=1 Tax=unclassified Corynebacterium TaxID=2624378 RepID=UPI0029CA6427|nr:MULTISPECIES: PIN domain-containing protein [unclassified Corynebacterium]WPF66889.1 PIN domain-containing protein [Corynebacterium sp. 22KM0430]WPF69377.1 PIN domain-containing protein [Corynebacterium sp. 21KM1197]